MLLLLGIVLWLAMQRNFEKDSQKYKSLITDIFEIQQNNICQLKFSIT